MKELLIRFREPLNTFWRRALFIFGILGGVAAFTTEVILPVLIDPEVSHELKDFLRPFYGWCIGIASAAKLTTNNPWALEFKKKVEQAAGDESA